MAKAEEEDIVDQEKKLKGEKTKDDDGDDDEEDEDKEGSDLEGKDADDIESESDDGDFELEGGDMALYDSALDDLDELQFVKETLTGLKQGREEVFAGLFGGLSAENQALLEKCLIESDQIKQKDDELKLRQEEINRQKKPKMF